MTHPLATKAAEKVQQIYFPHKHEVVDIIHTTALEPVLKAGEELEKALTKLGARVIEVYGKYEMTDLGDALKDGEQALAEWRKIKAGK